MPIGGPARPRESLRVWLMLAALVIAAFVGAATGLVWQRWIADDSPQEVGEDGLPVAEVEETEEAEEEPEEPEPTPSTT